MKVLALNGSPRKKGNTYQALKVVEEQLQENGIEMEIIQVGSQDIIGCKACGICRKNKDEKCVLEGDFVNEAFQKMKEADGFLLGSPVYFADINGTMKSFLDRTFYMAGSNGGTFRHKVGASIVALRRTGGMPAFQALNHYLQFAEMFMPSANYWNVVHGAAAGDVLADEEGIQLARILGKNMAFLMKAVNAMKVELPESEVKIKTNLGPK